MDNKHNKNSLIKNRIEFQLIKIQIGVNRAVNIMKKRDTPSIAKGAAPNIGSMLEIHLNFIIPCRYPSPSKEAHKRIVIVNVNKDQSKALFHKRAIFSLGVIKITNIPIKGVKNTNSKIISGRWGLNPQPTTPKADNLPN